MAAAAIPLAMTAVSAMQAGDKAKRQEAQYKKDNELAAATQQYSPWTHMEAQMPTRPQESQGSAMFGGAMSGLGSGLGAQQSATQAGGWGKMLGFGGGGGGGSPMAGAQQMSPMAGGYEQAPNLYNTTKSSWGNSRMIS